MTKEEFLAKSVELTNYLNDQGKVTATLTELYNEFEKVVDSNEVLTQEKETLTNKNKELKEYNMDLFMKIGDQEKKQEKELNNSFNKEVPEDKEEEPKLKYEDLFNEKGDFI